MPRCHEPPEPRQPPLQGDRGSSPPIAAQQRRDRRPAGPVAEPRPEAPGSTGRCRPSARGRSPRSATRAARASIEIPAPAAAAPRIGRRPSRSSARRTVAGRTERQRASAASSTAKPTRKRVSARSVVSAAAAARGRVEPVGRPRPGRGSGPVSPGPSSSTAISATRSRAERDRDDRDGRHRRAGSRARRSAPSHPHLR
jgi:hypothetical protein